MEYYLCKCTPSDDKEVGKLKCFICPQCKTEVSMIMLESGEILDLKEYKIKVS